MNNFPIVPATKNSIENRPPVFGVAINDADYLIFPKINGKKIMCPYYRKWANMLSRCYSVKTQSRQPCYVGCSVTKEWLIFSVFKAWMEKQDWQNGHLDKDLLVQGNKLYSPSTCLFVSREINNLLLDCKSTRGAYPQGVSLFKQDNTFKATISVNGKVKHLGYFDTPSEASNAYIKAKSALIKQIAEKQSPKLKYALLRHAESFLPLI